MVENHPSWESLERFALGELASEEKRGIERHLTLCSDCRGWADEAALLSSLPLLDGLYPGYDEAFERAVLGAAEQLAGLRGEARNSGDLFAELLREPASGRRRRIQEEDCFHSLKLCQLLRSHSQHHWFSDPASTLDLAELAVGVAERLDPRAYGAMLVEDARALSWGHLGNAFRISSDPWRAEQALRRAWGHHMQGSGDLYTETELLKFTSSLRITQRRLEEAVRLADRAIAIYREGQEHHQEGATLIKKGLALGEDRRYLEAIPAIRAGLAKIDAAGDPHLLLVGRHNLISLLFESGARGEAQRLLEESRPLYQAVGDRIILARLCWVEGHFDRKCGRLAAAETRLCAVREFFLDCQSQADVFLVSLDLAEVYARAGRYRQAKDLLGEVIPLGEALGLRRDVFLARLLYQQTSRREVG